MGVETATYIADLQSANPASTDLVSQGDDHVRLIKSVLQATFPGASRVSPVPTTLSKSADYTVVKNDGNSTIYVTTAGGTVNLTLPTLAAGDAGWYIYVIKTNSGGNPVFILPPSGTINSGGISGLAKCRRSIPGVQIKVIWDGSGFFVTRALSLPIGSCIEYHGSSLPAGYEWPNGQTLASASTNYPEYNSAMGSGVTLDKRGRVAIALDNLGGSSAGRLGGGIITGTAVGNVGGTDVVTLNTNQIPVHNHAVTDPGHVHVGNASTTVGTATSFVAGAGSGLVGATGAVTGNNFSTASATTGISIQNTGGGQSHSNLQPSIMVSEVLVVE